MTLGRKILFFLCYGAIPGGQFEAETLEHFLSFGENQNHGGYPGWEKIQTIKWVRIQTAWSLKHSKFFVDSILIDVGLMDKDYFRDSILRRELALRTQ